MIEAQNLPFPKHAKPRVWFISSFTCPTGQTVTKHALTHGDSVVAGILPGGNARRHEAPDRTEALQGFWEQAEKEGWKERVKVVKLDGSSVGLCQAAVADAVGAFGRIDILLCCTSETVIGTVEELGVTPIGQTLIRDQLETNLYGPMNVIRTVVPSMRQNAGGHIVIVNSVTGQSTIPGLGAYASAGWALEGFCDSIAYEVAPFNVKLTMIENNVEINLLTNKITSIQEMTASNSDQGRRPSARSFVGSLLDRVAQKLQGDLDTKGLDSKHLRSPQQANSFYPSLPASMRTSLVAETVYAIIAIAGHENPPSKHLIGAEAIASVKERLKTFSEELEDFVDTSYSVEAGEDGHKPIKVEEVESD